MNKVIVFLEKMWLVVAILCVLISGYTAFIGMKEDALYFLMFAALATVLFFLRRRTRKKIESSLKGNDS